MRGTVVRLPVLGAVLFGFMVLARPAPAATLVISTGELLGADDVDVGGTLYDVRFLDGTCAGLFSGCDEPGDFTFTTVAGATVASQALLDQVFIGQFDIDPELTFGCENTIICQAFTPYGVAGGFAEVAFASNRADLLIDSVSAGALGRTQDQGGSSSGVFAAWTLADVVTPPPPPAVPEPASLVLLGIGLAAARLGRARRRL